MEGIGIPHLLILMVIILLIFGPSRLPGLGASLGKAIRGFKHGLNDLDGDKEAAQTRPEQINSAQSSTTADATKTKDPQRQS